MNYRYAQLDENGLVVCVSQLAGEVSALDMVHLDGSRQNDESVSLGWRLIEGEWHEPVPEPEPEYVPPVTTDEIKEYQLLNMELTLGLMEMLSEGGIAAE